MVLKSPESWQLAIRLQHFRIGRRQMQLLYFRRHCERSEAIQDLSAERRWIASRSLSSGRASRGPVGS
jgi:hypothetical protein